MLTFAAYAYAAYAAATIKRDLRLFFQRFYPSKLPKLNKALQHFADREVELRDRIRLKYGEKFQQFEKRIVHTCGQLDIDHVYVLHYTPQVERKKFMTDGLAAVGFDVEQVTFVEDFDAEALPTNANQLYYSQMKHLYPTASGKDYGHYSWWGARALAMAPLSIALKHGEAFRQIVSAHHAVSLVMENDIALAENFMEVIKEHLQSIDSCQDDWHLVSLDSGGEGGQVPDKLGFELMHNYCTGNKSNGLSEACLDFECFDTPGPGVYRKVQTVRDIPLYYNGPYSPMRAVGAYLISFHGAKLLHENWLPLAFHVDNQFNFLATLLDLRVYWVDPPIATQESIGRFRSSTNKQLPLYTRAELTASSLQSLEIRPHAPYAGEVCVTLADNYIAEGDFVRAAEFLSKALLSGQVPKAAMHERCIRVALALATQDHKQASHLLRQSVDHLKVKLQNQQQQSTPTDMNAHERIAELAHNFIEGGNVGSLQTIVAGLFEPAGEFSEIIEKTIELRNGGHVPISLYPLHAKIGMFEEKRKDAYAQQHAKQEH